MSGPRRDGAHGGPTITPVADRAVLVEFGTAVSDATIADVRAFDRRVAGAEVPGVVEVVPSGVNALVVFDPLQTDHERTIEILDRLVSATPVPEPPPERRTVEVCYDGDLAPDLAEVADRAGCTVEEVVAAHCGASYRVVMFGFAPGAAYLRGIDPRIRLPRKAAAVRDVPAGSVIIAGEQCLVMPITMPTGWFVVGRALAIPQPWPTPGEAGVGGPATPGVTVEVGDEVRFVPVARTALDAGGRS